MPDNNAGVTVIIPTLNGERWLREIFPLLRKQTRSPDEILVVDSGSSDETLELAETFGARTVGIEPQAFDHGGTRSMAAQLAAGDILVYMTQDAVPGDSRALENLIAPLADQRVAAAYGRQMPDPDATCFAAHLRLFNYPGKSSIRCWEDRKRYGFRTAFISNSFAAYRKPELASVGYFEERMLFGEDTFTVAKLLRRGYCVAYVADAPVRHSHNYSILEDFRRYFDIGVLHADRREMFAGFGNPAGEGKRYLLSEMSYLAGKGLYLRLPECIIRIGMKFLAYNLGKRYKFLPRSVAAACSLNRKWWKNTK